MADTSNLTQFLTDVAGAIKEKTGKTDKIPAANFDAEILSIKTGGSGDVKLFETEEEMQSDTTAKEGDLAVVYRIEIQNATVDSKFQVATFPETVVLNSAITDYAEFSYIAVDSSVTFGCTGSLDSSMFTMNYYTETRDVTIQYTSYDGITYTRDDTTGNPVDFGTKIYYENSEMWNDAIGKFIQIGGSTFEGLYKCNKNNWVLAPTQLTAIADYVYEKEFYGQNGVETGTLTTSVSNSFADTNAAVYGNIQQAYDSMTPRVLTDTDKTIDKNIYFIPVKKDGTVLLNTSSVTDMSKMFKNCTNLMSIPLLDTSSVIDMGYMFQNCTNLTSIPLLDTSSVIEMGYMFKNCTNLTEISLLDTSSVTNMYHMFDGCTNLTTIPLLDTSKVTIMGYIFGGCSSLSDNSLNNILAMCTNATKITSNKTLKNIGLTSDQATKCTTLSNYSAFTAAGWTTGY